MLVKSAPCALGMPSSFWYLDGFFPWLPSQQQVSPYYLYVSSQISTGVGQWEEKWLMSVFMLASFPEAIGKDYFPSALHGASINFVVRK